MSAFSKPARFAFAVLALVCAWGLTGCGANVSATDQSYALPGVAISGNVHGGVFPIQGATIRLMETQSNGYGGAAKQLQQTTSDSSGYFTFSDSNWSCDSSQFVYITVTAGHTATNAANYNVAQIGVVGNCGQVLGSVSAFDKVQVFVSELSTIAAAYTLRGFITVDNTNAATGQQIINISAPANNNASSGVCTFTSPTSCVAAGLAHGFQNAYNLVDSVNYNNVLPSGQARTVPPSNSTGDAVVPQAEINTLGNILQSCVDSAGGTVGTYSTYSPGSASSTRCGDLFYYTTAPGSTTPPTNTLEAALNMAQYPANNATNLFNLQPRAVFFTPDLNTAPHDLSVSIVYVTNYIGSNNLPVPLGLALDANDDAFVLATSAAGTANTKTSVLGLAANGAILFAGTPSTTYLAPKNIAVDALNNIWFTNDSTTSGAVLKASASNGAISVGTTLASAAGLAVDKFNNVWVSLDSTTANSVQKFTNSSLSGSATPAVKSNALGAGLLSLALDGSSNVWSLNSTGTNSAAVVFANTGSNTSPAYANNLSSQTMNSSAGTGMAANAAGEVYYPLKSQIDDALYSTSLSVNNLGTFSGSSQDNATYAVPNLSEVDGAGNLFFTDYENAGHLFEFVPGSNGTMSSGALYSITTCYVYGSACLYNAIPYERSLQIDSSGALWYLADVNVNGTAYGAIVQTFGAGAPTWPLMALQQPGAKPQ